MQAVLNVYETFHRADGHTIKLAPDRGEGQHWNIAPGNLYSKPMKVHIGASAAALKLTLDQVIPPIAPIADTKYIRHIRIEIGAADEVLGQAGISVSGGAGTGRF